MLARIEIKRLVHYAGIIASASQIAHSTYAQKTLLESAKQKNAAHCREAALVLPEFVDGRMARIYSAFS